MAKFTWLRTIVQKLFSSSKNVGEAATKFAVPKAATKVKLPKQPIRNQTYYDTLAKELETGQMTYNPRTGNTLYSVANPDNNMTVLLSGNVPKDAVTFGKQLKWNLDAFPAGTRSLVSYDWAGGTKITRRFGKNVWPTFTSANSVVSKI